MNSDEYYFHDPDYYLELHFQGNVCSDDPHFYQACDKRLGSKITNNELLCEHYLCGGYTDIFTSYEVSLHKSRCEYDCKNTELNKAGCSDRNITLPSGQLANPNEICDGVCDNDECEDEALCNGYMYGLYCKPRYAYQRGYVPPRLICSLQSSCYEGQDLENCTVTENTGAFCTHVSSGEMVPIHNYTKCTSVNANNFYVSYHQMTYCALKDLALQQTNCTDEHRVGLSCEINGYKSTVSKYIICFSDDFSACDDGIDSKCFTTPNCNVHKHLMCNDKKECEDGSDETHLTCNSTTVATCQRRVGEKGEHPIPISWLKDGVWDCENGVDETAEWPTCGQGKTLRFASTDADLCENVFICRTGEPGYIEMSYLCDGLETCGNENEVCSVSSRSQTLDTSVVTSNKGLLKTLSFCFKGLKDLRNLDNVTCVKENFIYPDEKIFGVDTKTAIILPDTKQTCDYLYGEQYLYTSCTDRCFHASCPLRNIPRYEVCPGQFPNRIGTIVNNEYLIFFTKSFGSIYLNRFFVCDDKVKCIDYSKVCDLVYDCSDGSDENQCTNHFRCQSSGKLLPKTKKCDGHIDCPDLSDECNEQCSKSILEGDLIKGLSWLIGILAVLANMVIIMKSIRTLKRCKTSVALINRMLIIAIALGDFLVGCYLVTIATYDALVYRAGYCRSQLTWITSFECSLIGILSTIGSQISLFSMTGLSVVRIHGIYTITRFLHDCKIFILLYNSNKRCQIKVPRHLGG